LLYATYAKLTERLRNFVAIQKESLRTIFSSTVQQQLGKHYAMNRQKDCNDDEIMINGENVSQWPIEGGCSAIPADNGKPQYDSLFGTSLERLYYTSFAVMQQKVNCTFVNIDLEDWDDKIREEKEKIQAAGDSLRYFKKTNGMWKALIDRYSGFKSELDDGIQGLTEVDKQKICIWVNEHPSRQLPFIRQYYLPKIRVYPSEIQTSTHFFPLVADASLRDKKRENPRLQGMSGTLFNRHTYPRKVFDDIADAVSDTTCNYLLS
jgi:hypothetical protein